MLGLGTLTRYAKLDATMGLAFASTGFLYPLFGTFSGLRSPSEFKRANV